MTRFFSVCLVLGFGYVEARAPELPADGPLVLHLPATETVHGRVLDASTREPVLGAWVSFSADARRVDAHGAYSLRLAAGSSQMIEVTAPGYLKKGVEVAAGSLPDGELNIALVPSMALAGRVVDGDGSGLEGAEVRAAPDMSSIADRARMRMSPDLLAEEAWSRSGADGGFRLEGLAPERGYELRITRRGFAQRRLPVPALTPGAAPPEIEIVLAPGLEAFGVVLDDAEEPIAGAEVVLLEAPRATGRVRIHYHYQAEPGRRAATTVGGRFEFSDLAPGIVSLRVSAAGFTPLSVPGIEIAGGERPTDLGTLLLERGVPLHGRVTDAAGDGIEGAQVTAVAAEGTESRLQDIVTTESDGSFTVPGLPRTGRLEVSAWREGYRHKFLPSLIRDPDRSLVIVLEPGYTISGQVVGPRGDPAARASVTLQRTSSMGSSSNGGMTDGEGRFAFPDEAPGEVTIIASSAEGVGGPVAIEIPTGSELRIVLSPAAILSGRLSDPEGVAVAQASLRLEPVRPGAFEGHTIIGSAKHAASDADGRFAFAGLAGGPYRLLAEHPGFEPLAEPVEIDPGVHRDLELAFGARKDRESLHVSGRVVDGAGDGVDSAVIQLAQVLPGHEHKPYVMGQTKATSFADGAFEIQAPAAGTWAVWVAHPDFAPRRSEPVVVGEAAVAEVLVQLFPGSTVSGRVHGLELEQMAHLSVYASSRGHFRAGRVSHDGSYRIDHLGPGEWFVAAALGNAGRSANTKVTLGEGGDAVELDLTFERGFRVSGVALRDGLPLSEAVLDLACRRRRFSNRTVLDSEGRFLVEDVAGGTCVLTFSDRAAWVVVTQREVGVEGDTEVMIDIVTAELSGRVLAAGGRVPVAGVQVTLRLPGSHLAMPPSAKAQTDALGRFTLRPAGQRTWALQAAVEGFLTARRNVDLTGPVNDLEIVIEPAVPAVVYVRDARGGVPRQVAVQVADASGRQVERLIYQPDLDGKIVLRKLGPGTWRLTVSGDEGAGARAELVVPGEPLQLVLGK